MNNNKRVLFITQDDPFYIREFFEEFFNNYSQLNNILGVVICPTMGKKSFFKLIKQMFDFYGMQDFSIMVWRYLMAKKRKNTLHNLCRKYNINIYKVRDINSDKFIENWRVYNLDVIISVAAPQVFKNKLINLAKWGCINIHHAKLPRYRGMMPNFWQMFNSEDHVGITVHRINSKIDEGEIILQRELPVKINESLDELIRRTKREGAHCIIEALSIINKGPVSYLTNNPEEGNYFGFPSKQNVREFRIRGKRIL